MDIDERIMSLRLENETCVLGIYVDSFPLLERPVMPVSLTFTPFGDGHLHSATTELKNLTHSREDILVEHDSLKLQVTKLRELLNLRADEVSCYAYLLVYVGGEEKGVVAPPGFHNDICAIPLCFFFFACRFVDWRIAKLSLRSHSRNGSTNFLCIGLLSRLSPDALIYVIPDTKSEEGSVLSIHL